MVPLSLLLSVHFYFLLSCCFSQETQQPADDAVAEVTQQLQSMGFDDEGGWLTELVRARGGDIDKVLETLHWEK